jgi:hypothetical protein
MESIARPKRPGSLLGRFWLSLCYINRRIRSTGFGAVRRRIILEGFPPPGNRYESEKPQLFGSLDERGSSV